MSASEPMIQRMAPPVTPLRLALSPTTKPAAGANAPPASFVAPSAPRRDERASSVSSVDDHLAQLDSRLKWELGPTILKSLEDDRIIEVMLNPDGKIWVDVAARGLFDTNTELSPSQALSLIRSIASRSDEKAVTPENPTFEGTIPGNIPGSGSRFAAVIPPIVERPTFAIRKRAKMIYTLDQYVQALICSPSHARFFRDAVEQKKNILVIGGTGSGKTTFCNALLSVIAEHAVRSNERIVIIEDSARELQCSAPNTVQMLTSRHRSMQDLLRLTMRMRPDRVVIGETRGAEIWSMMKAWNSGHPGGVSTIHANSAIGGLHKAESYVLEAGVPVQRDQIADSIDVLVFIEKTPSAPGVPATRLISEVALLKGVDSRGEYVLENVPAESRELSSL